MNPKVSVIIPTYRRAHLVTRAIASVLNQTFQDLEIIVVDDCSPDDTKSAVLSIGDPRIRYLRHERNKGLPSGRNTGIAAARGQYIAFLDDDDGWLPEKLERQLAVIEGYGAVLCGALINGERVKIFRGQEVELSDLRKGNEFDPSSLLADAAILRRVGFDESLRQGEDWDAFIRLAQQCKLRYLAEPLLLYDDGDHDRMTNAAKQMSAAELEARMPVLHKHKTFFGSFWYRFHVADTYLSYISARKGKVEMVRLAARRCGWWPVALVFWRKVLSKLSTVRSKRLASRWFGSGVPGRARENIGGETLGLLSSSKLPWS